MNKLNYESLLQTGYSGFLLKDAPERILQFGEGNFLRAFVDYFVDLLNERTDFNGKIVVTQPIANGLAPLINEQEGLYTLYLRGIENGEQISKKRVISSISRCLNPYENYAELLACALNPDLSIIVSNTTEAGIVFDPDSSYAQQPPHSFPAKLTRFLHERFLNQGKGFIILSCELIDDNGKELKKCVDQYIDTWELGQDFKTWVDQENQFCSTLVDRIVTGYPRGETDALNAENGYLDQLLDTGETFGFWVIEGSQSILDVLPFDQAHLPILVTDNHKPYKQQKVRILNGAHTSMVLAAYLAGQDIVRECMKDDVIRGFMNQTIYEEIIPSIVTLPSCIVLSFAAYIAFYHRGEWQDGHFMGTRGDNQYEISDDKWVLDFYSDHKNDSREALVQAVCSNTQMWGQDLTLIPGFAEQVLSFLTEMDVKGIYQTLAHCLSLENQR